MKHWVIDYHGEIHLMAAAVIIKNRDGAGLGALGGIGVIPSDLPNGERSLMIAGSEGDRARTGGAIAPGDRRCGHSFSRAIWRIGKARVCEIDDGYCCGLV